MQDIIDFYRNEDLSFKDIANIEIEYLQEKASKYNLSFDKTKFSFLFSDDSCDGELRISTWAYLLEDYIAEDSADDYEEPRNHKLMDKAVYDTLHGDFEHAKKGLNLILKSSDENSLLQDAFNLSNRIATAQDYLKKIEYLESNEEDVNPDELQKLFDEVVDYEVECLEMLKEFLQAAEKSAMYTTKQKAVESELYPEKKTSIKNILSRYPKQLEDFVNTKDTLIKEQQSDYDLHLLVYNYILSQIPIPHSNDLFKLTSNLQRDTSCFKDKDFFGGFFIERINAEDSSKIKEKVAKSNEKIRNEIENLFNQLNNLGYLERNIDCMHLFVYRLTQYLPFGQKIEKKPLIWGQGNTDDVEQLLILTNYALGINEGYRRDKYSRSEMIFKFSPENKDLKFPKSPSLRSFEKNQANNPLFKLAKEFGDRIHNIHKEFKKSLEKIEAKEHEKRRNQRNLELKSRGSKK